MSGLWSDHTHTHTYTHTLVEETYIKSEYFLLDLQTDRKMYIFDGQHVNQHGDHSDVKFC